MQIYKITNNKTGKMYIGQTSHDITYRWELHMHDYERGRKSNYPLYSAFAKYGVDNFTIEVLKDNIQSFEELDYWEKFYIRELSTLSPNGYNLTAGGQGIHGYHHTDDAKKRIGESVMHNKDKIYTVERAKKISDALSGRKFSIEHKKKLSDIAKSRTGEKNPFYNKRHSDDTKRRISLKNSKPIEQYDRVTGELINRFNTKRDAAMYVLSNHLTNAKVDSVMQAIGFCCMNLRSVSYGYVWKYVDREV